jgi:pimeloyl-ACP methyl ester carboxylesterase
MSLKQLRKSWYMFLFQLPAVPEWLIRRDNFKVLRGMLRYSGYQRPVMSEAEYQIFAAAFMQPGALTAAINYYRAALRGNPLALKRQVQPVSCSTLLIWGEKDVALGKELTYGLSPLVPRLRVQYIEDAGHWVQQEKPEAVNHHLLQFLQAE